LKRMEGEVAMTLMTTTTYVAYDDGANGDEGIVGWGNSRWRQFLDAINNQIGARRGEGGGTCANDDDNNDEARGKNTQQPTTSSGRAIEGERDGGEGSWQ